MSKGTIVIAAGGTGGHLFPAKALAAVLRQRGWQLALATDRRGGAYGEHFPDMPIYRLHAAGSGGGAIRKLRAAAETAYGVWQARRLLARLRPAAVIGFGGYPSLPAVLAATMLGIPTVIHEQNAVLGRVNRLLAGRVDLIATSHHKVQGLPDALTPRVRFTGNPVDAAFAGLRAMPYRPPTPGGPLRLLITGGSQGARIFSDVVPEALAAMEDGLRRRLHVVQQCRAEDLERVRAVYAGAGIAASLDSFIDDMAGIMAATHLAVTRAGASTIAELTVAGRPAVLVPYPHATDDHQSANARAMADLGGAWLIPQEKFTPTTCRESLEALLNDPRMLARMAKAALAGGQPDAADRLAGLVEDLAGQGNGGGNGGSMKERAAA